MLLGMRPTLNQLIDRGVARAGSQRNLASAISVGGQSGISRWRSGERRPKARAYRALLKYLGYSLGEVDRLTGEWLDQQKDQEEETA